MKTHQVLLLAVIAFLAASCEKENPGVPGAWPSAPLASSVPDNLESKYSNAELPGRIAKFNAVPTGRSTPIAIAHGVPRLEKELRGPYSVLGSAREFKHITGGDLPDWIKPTTGNYSISKRGYGLTCWSYLDYEFDPARGKELQDLISRNFAKKWPNEKPIQWIDGYFARNWPNEKPIQEDKTGERLDVYGLARVEKPGLILVHRLVINIFPTGRLHLADTRGVDPD